MQVTSFDSVEDGALGDVLTQRVEKRTLKVGLLGLGYFEYWRMYPELQGIVADDLLNVKENLTKTLDGYEVIYPGMVDTLDKAEAAATEFTKESVDVIIVVAGTYIPDFITIHTLNRSSKSPFIILFNSQTGNDVSPDDDYMATMRNSALIAISQLTGSFQKMKRPYDVIVGEVNDPRPYQEISGTIQALQSVRNLKSSTYGLIGHVFRGMYDLEFDAAKVKGFFGPEVMTIQAEHLIETWRSVEDTDVEALANKMSDRFTIKKINEDDIKRSCKVALAMKRLYSKFNLDGMCFLGQHYIEKMTGAPARIGASLMLEEENVMVTCEGDIAGLVMMQLMYDFTGNIPLQAEWGQFDKKNNALFLLGHGIASPCLAKADEDVTLTCAPEEWGFEGKGLNYEMIMRPGPVTLGHFLNTGDSWRMLISKGEAIDFPCLPCDEIHAMIRVASPVEDYIKDVLTHGAAHHLIAVHGSIVDKLVKVAELMRIETLKIN